MDSFSCFKAAAAKRSLGLLLSALLLGLATPDRAAAEIELRTRDLSPGVSSELATDVVVISEGYSVEDRDEFFRDAWRIHRSLKSHVVSRPLRAAFDFKVHALFVPSKQSGVPWTPGQRARRTTLRSHVTLPDGDLVIDEAEADSLAVEHAPDVDVTVVLIHYLDDDDPSAEDSSVPEVVAGRDDLRAIADMPDEGGRIRLPSHDIEAFVHELGHALLGLGDEYWTEDAKIPAESAWEVAVCPNLSTDSSGARWRSLVRGAHEGGGYWRYGVWRPERFCRMKESRSRNFCTVCRAVIKQHAGQVEPEPPSITGPRSGARIDFAGDEARLPVTWEARGEDPLFWEILVARVDDDGDEVYVVEDWIEGHRRSHEAVFSELEPGRYRVTVSAVGAAGASATRRRTVHLRRSTEVRSPGLGAGLRD